MKTLLLLLRWTDDKGNQQVKEYTDEKQARKARDWLLERGATNVDIAIRLEKRSTPAENTGA